MKTHNTHTFTLSAPENFQVVKENTISVWLQDEGPQSSVQNPSIQTTLQHISAYNSSKANTLEERFYESNISLRYKAESIETFQTELHGTTCFVQLAQTNATFQGKPLKVSYYFAMVQINEQYVIEMACDVMTEDWERYRPQFEAVCQSLAYESDIETCEKAKALYDKELARDIKQNRIDYQTRAEKEQQEWLETYIHSVEKTEGNCFQLGDYGFEVAWDENRTQWCIGKMTRKFHCDIVVKTKQADELIDKEILSDLNEEGELKISFTYQGLYHHGLPKAKISVEKGKIVSKQYMPFRIDGLRYSLIAFDGKIFIDETGVKIFGNMNDGLRNGQKLPVNIQIAFNANDLDWNQYSFTTLKELQTAPPELVKFIALNVPVAELPSYVQAFKNLKSLSVGHRINRRPESLRKIPDWIDALTQLESLSVSSPNLAELPEAVAALPKLKSLSIFNTEIKKLPDAVWQMQHLESLSLDNNQLELIPGSVHLPNVKWISLAYNQLKHLPVSLANLPRLNLIKLIGNDWEYLPPSVEQIKKVDLEIEYKRKFFDYDYQGADGKGVIAWNGDAFFAKHDAGLMQSIEDYWNDGERKMYQKDLTKLLKKTIGFRLGKAEDYKQIGNHRIGGMPDLPKSTAYPSFQDDDNEGYLYEFLAQINCAAIAHLQEYLPKTGMLYFFLSTIHNVYGGNNAAKVIYFDGDQSELQSGSHFNFKQDDYFEAFDDVPYQGYQSEAHAFADLPSFYPIHQNKYLLEGLSTEFTEALLGDHDMGYELNEAFEAFQSEQIPAINSYGFSQHEYPEHEVALAYRGNPMDWVILLKLPSIGDFQWGDAGDLFYVIHKSDLAKRDFSNVICTMYSS